MTPRRTLLATLLAASLAGIATLVAPEDASPEDTLSAWGVSEFVVRGETIVSGGTAGEHRPDPITTILLDLPPGQCLAFGEVGPPRGGCMEATDIISMLRDCRGVGRVGDRLEGLWLDVRQVDTCLFEVELHQSQAELFDALVARPGRARSWEAQIRAELEPLSRDTLTSTQLRAVGRRM